MVVQFEEFFSDKANVNPSSYKTKSNLGLSVLYLHDTKKNLWKKFSETYPNGIVDRKKKMNALQMCQELQEQANKDELEPEEIPKLSTVQNWIIKIASVMKQKLAKQIVKKAENLKI
ncbi:15121_t:CDS:2 [Cetraspora pellucida]|uniref:15121_t:CDS:1 n=1 Tax=Cetraspora pellucida TaxID=1433469 RepID=A0ACA9KWX6_9GLOM|nr:15121_t:CDS:2 [Cetraspora pellucida]